MAITDSRIPSAEIVEKQLQKSKRRRLIFQRAIVTIGVLATVAAAAVIIAVLFLQVFKIEGRSMAETLQEGDLVVVEGISGFQKGDVVACYYGNDVLVKRIIATAGDTVEIDEEGNVTVNGESLEEPYVRDKTIGNCNIEFPCTVPEGSNFVLGDCRSVSIDSRSSAIGCIEDRNIIGRVIFRIWPIGSAGKVK
ncbi:MAG: signal peptidase I [Roseburia sp.]|nr:signal peptidase I [Roseburia sp.]MCM1097914.1 signal peptidase I [Ruminococcus flavefaciens]